jgi:restriction endonuclease S subunit
MKDLTEDNLVDHRNLVFIELNDLKDHHKVELNDLVLRSRGQTNTAALVHLNTAPSVVAAPLLRIRVEKDSILPAYLCWFINQPSSQTFLQSRATGTAMRMIGKSVLDDLEIMVPSMNMQQHIVRLEKLSSQEQRLMNKLSIKKQLLMHKILIDLATEIQ